ncbi:MAG: endonuclease/exonuclease/phosphatase family protein [Bdellovibrionota bacterium]
MTLKILSYNIHKGYDWNNKNYFLNEIKELIKDVDADLVFLQEVVGQSNKYRKYGQLDVQFEFLADSLWSQFAYAKNAVYDGGHHGNMILSKYPVTNWENLDISTNFIEKRGLLIVQIEIPNLNNKKIFAATLHLDVFHRGRKQQYQMIKNKILSLNLNDQTPLIIAGDFNDWNKKAAEVLNKELGMEEVYQKKHKTFAKTFPAGYPFLCLDRVYVKNCKVLDASIWHNSSQRHFSDHLPLFCEVEIAE